MRNRLIIKISEKLDFKQKIRASHSNLGYINKKFHVAPVFATKNVKPNLFLVETE